MLRRLHLSWIIVLILGTAAYISADAERMPSETAEPATALKRVKAGGVEAAKDSRELRFSGTTRSARRARLSFTTGGRLVGRPVEIGDRVQQGQILARIDDSELRNAAASAQGALAELEARRAQSERDQARAERLVAAKAATSEELERTSAAVAALKAAEEAARARLLEAERRLATTRLTAPFAGTVTEVFFEPGEYAGIGAPVIALSGEGPIELEVEVPEAVISRVAVGDAVELKLSALDRSAAGRIESVGWTAAGPGRLFPVVVALDAAEQVRAGATAELVLEVATDRALSLPVEAVVNPGGRRPAVFRIQDASTEAAPKPTARVERLTVEVGSLVGDRVIVRGDLQVGDLVVIGGQRGLLEGDRVEIEEVAP
ncbi:MAG: efflux RND transporter periplasmic adaptor subunit [Acidobacteriota bacterium]